MATLVLTTVGTALGGPIGGALGSLVGGAIEQGLTGRRRKGPRLGDLAVQTSSYGSPIPRIYGKMRVAGTVIWATDLEEEEVIEGGGKGSPERLTYSYSANLAVALSSRPIHSVGRIWADGKLIRGAAGDFKVRTGFRLALGGEDQGVDPLIGAIETIDQAPAYRGLALAIFEDLELAEFGNRIPMLTFEVVADDEPVGLGSLLEDASEGVVEAADTRPIVGFAAHGSSVRDSLETLIDLSGLTLAEREGRLHAAVPGEPELIADHELGCGADRPAGGKIEHGRSSVTTLPASLAMTYYDPDRDYQAGQARASSGQRVARDEQIELPAVLTASEAKQMVEGTLSRRWRTADRMKLRLPPSRMGLRPGDAIRLESQPGLWSITGVSIEAMVVAVEAEAAAIGVAVGPADGGRPVSEPDVQAGRSELALFELPPDGEAPGAVPRALLAASNAGLWKRLPVGLTLAANPISGMALHRRAVLGRAETVLNARVPVTIDELSAVRVRLTNDQQLLLNADWDALVSGANLAVLGDELIQFGLAERLEPGLFRLSRLLRGRRGTEWAAAGHAVGEWFCMIDAAAIGVAELPPSAIGATLQAVAHGIGDAAPLPHASRQISGEAMRPPSPCHLTAVPVEAGLLVNWVRRSHRHWSWLDGVGDGPDGFPEYYRLEASGPSGTVRLETHEQSVLLDASQLPGGPGQSVLVSVATVGPSALSRPATATITL